LVGKYDASTMNRLVGVLQGFPQGIRSPLSAVRWSLRAASNAEVALGGK